MIKVLIKYNQITHLPEDYQSRVKSLSDFYQQIPFDSDFIVVDTDDLDRCFTDIENINPDWVVVISLGHCTQDRYLYDKAIDHCQENHIQLLAHVMDFENQYPHIHPQMCVINYRSWKEAGKPTWNYVPGPVEVSAKNYVPSEEKFHDSYTPLWLRPLEGTKKEIFPDLQVGAKVIDSFMTRGWEIHNIPTALRKNKWHLYPDQCWSEFHSFLKGETYQGTNSAQKHYAGLIGHLSDQVRRQYYVLNTEPLTTVGADQVISQYAGVASGIKLFCSMTKNGFNDDTAVTIFDFSDVALEFQRYLIEEWNGDFSVYQVLCKKFEDAHPDNFPCLPSGAWEDSYQYVLDQLGLDAVDFQKSWQKYQKLNHRFEKINLYDTDDQQRLVDILKAQGGFAYVWISNAFYMEYSMITIGKENLKHIRNSFVDQLRRSGTHGVLDSHDHWSQGLIRFDQQ
jgi:hypothetical protein